MQIKFTLVLLESSITFFNVYTCDQTETAYTYYNIYPCNATYKHIIWKIFTESKNMPKWAPVSVRVLTHADIPNNEMAK